MWKFLLTIFSLAFFFVSSNSFQFDECTDYDPICGYIMTNCHYPGMTVRMKAMCRKSCGFCKSTDKKSTKTPDNKHPKDLPKQNEPKSTGPCVNFYGDKCAEIKEEIKGEEYKGKEISQAYKETCAKTFGLCKETSGDKKDWGNFTDPWPKDPRCMDTNPACHLMNKACSEMYDEMSQKCPKSCGICELANEADYEGICEDRQEGCDVDEIKKKCNDPDPKSKDWIEKLCPKTCGVCDKKTLKKQPKKAKECKDLNEKTCRFMYHECKNPQRYIQVRELCPETCGLCTKNGRPKFEGKCVDVSPECKESKDGCNKEEYKETMTEMCRKTCGFCGKDGDRGQGNSKKNVPKRPVPKKNPKNVSKKQPKVGK